MSFVQSAVEFAGLFPDAVLCGIVMAVVCAVFGVFVVLRRIVFVSMALSEAATCGVALGMTCGFSPFAGSVLVTSLVVVLALKGGRSRILPTDVMLGVAFLLASATSLLLVSGSGFGLEEVKAMLYGDLVLSGPHDRRVLLWTGLPALLLLLLFFRPVFYRFFDNEWAATVDRGTIGWFWEVFYFFLLGVVVSGASKSGGALLVFCLLVVAPATGLLLGRSMGVVFVLSALSGLISVLGGLTIAYRADLPANPTVIVLLCLLFIVMAVIRKTGIWLRAWIWRTRLVVN